MEGGSVADKCRPAPQKILVRSGAAEPRSPGETARTIQKVGLAELGLLIRRQNRIEGRVGFVLDRHDLTDQGANSCR